MTEFKGSVLDNCLHPMPKERLERMLKYIDGAIKYWNKEDPAKAGFFIEAKKKCEKLIKKA